MHIVGYSLPKHRALLDGGASAVNEWHVEWTAFERAIPAADCAVAVIERLNAVPGAAELKVLRRARLASSVVLVTPIDKENARHVPGTCDALVPLEDAKEDLRKAVLDASTSLCGRLARHIRNRLTCTIELKTWLLEAVLADPPPSSVKEWVEVRAVACGVRTLERRFTREFKSGICPAFFLRLIRLLYALDQSPARPSRARLALLAGCDPRTIRALAMELSESTFRKAADPDGIAMVAALIDRLR